MVLTGPVPFRLTAVLGRGVSKYHLKVGWNLDAPPPMHCTLWVSMIHVAQTSFTHLVCDQGEILIYHWGTAAPFCKICQLGLLWVTRGTGRR